MPLSDVRSRIQSLNGRGCQACHPGRKDPVRVGQSLSLAGPVCLRGRAPLEKALQACYLEDSVFFKTKSIETSWGDRVLEALGFGEKLTSDLFFLLYTHLPERKPTVTWCHLEPQRLAPTPHLPNPRPDPSHLWKPPFAAPAGKPSPARNFVLRSLRGHT